MTQGRVKIPVEERLQSKLDVEILPYIGGDFPPELKDAHWIWQGKIRAPQRRRYYSSQTHKHREAIFQTPVRIRDEDGVIVPAVRLLHRLCRGFDYPYVPRRDAGCDFRCVNPFHLKMPTGLDEPEVPVVDVVDDIQGLISEIEGFIASNGRDEDRIYERFLLDYSEEEIAEALRRIT